MATIHGNKNVSFHSRRQLPPLARVGPKDFQIVRLLGAGDVGRVYLVRKNKDVLIPQARG